MNSFCAIYTWNAPIDRDLLERMRDRMSHHGDVARSWVDGSVGFVTMNWQASSFSEDRSLLRRLETCWIAADVRLDYRKDLVNRFADQKRGLENASDVELLAASYARWGEACVKYLEGDYAFVLWDRERQRFFGARSVVGLRPLVYHVNPQRFFCASDPAHLFEDPGVSHELNTTWVAFWLTRGQGHWEGTIYREIQTLTPGHVLIVDTTGVKVKPFWQPPVSSRALLIKQEEYTEQFRMLLTGAVQTRLQDHRRLYFDLSGGLDSSSLVSLAARLWRQEEKLPPLDCFYAESNGSLPYIQSVTEKYTEIHVDTFPFHEHLHFDGAFDPAPWTVFPCRPTLILATFYRKLWVLAAQRGAQVHVRGDFGDELLGASLDYLGIYWKEHQIGKLISEMLRWNRASGFPSRALFEQWVIHPYLQQWNEARNKQKEQSISWLRRSVLQESRERLQQDEEYFRILCPDPYIRGLVRWIYFHVDYSIQADVAREMAGLETREPFTDLRLIEFLLSTPPQYQIRPEQSKFLLREAMQGILPEMVRQRKGKGRAYRLYFQGFKKHREHLRQVVVQMPELLTPFIHQTPLLAAIDGIALGGQTDVPAMSGALALVLWAHRLPWANGNLPVLPG